MNLFNLSRKQCGASTSIVIIILAILAVTGGAIYLLTDKDSANSTNNVPEKTVQVGQQPQNSTSSSPNKQSIQEKPEVQIDPDLFCSQIAEVGTIYNEELTGATIRTNVSFGPQVGCSWSGPYVLVYFGDDSYNRRNTGFGTDYLVAYEHTDQEAVKREKYAVHSGFEVEVKSDSGRAFRISQSTGRQTDLTPQEYKRIANIVNGVLNQHY